MIVLADTSIWIDFFRARLWQHSDRVDFARFATCGPIIQEVFQGLSSGPDALAFGARLTALPVLSDPLPLALFRSAAEIFREGRARGYTIRSSIDCLIAAIAIENAVPLWHRDRDFDVIARFTRLQVVRSIN